ncbi:MAG: thiamine phosphate synthase [Odoribacter sp.]
MKIIVITSPDRIKDEAVICNLLFAHGLDCLHIRKPGMPLAEYEKFIQQLDSGYHNRIVVHEHYELVRKYQLHGIHLKSGKGDEYAHYSYCRSISISCHSVEEIKHLPFQPAYCFLSPIFDSISKQGYQSRFVELPDLCGLNLPVIALGGITPERIKICRKTGFTGVAALGYLWENPEEALNRYIRLKTPEAMSIAGFDPSSGAGVTADLKTLEATGCYGLGVCSAITFQNETTYTGTHWICLEEIQKQCDLLFQKHQPEFLKIGLIENFEVMDQLTDYLTMTCPDLKIIWDPILKASAGFVFHESRKAENQKRLNDILNRIYLITPNTDEVYQLFGSDCQVEDLQKICRTHSVNILWKGGHNGGRIASDCLITADTTDTFSVERSVYSKHGTGCVLSSALTSALSQGATLPEACNKAQLYVSRLINSNDSLLGYHSIGEYMENSKPSPLTLNLQYITAPKENMTLCEQAEAVCKGGIRWVQLRMKEATIDEMLHEGMIMKKICQRYNALFIINDQVEVARQLDADGVHLGKEDMNPLEARKILGKHKIIGATCNTWEDVLLRQQQQVDYIGLGPFTFTTTKEKLSPVMGVEGYRRLLQRMQENDIHIPVFAIGGITETDISPLMQTGISGIALSGLIKNSEKPTQKTKEIITILNYK